MSKKTKNLFIASIVAYFLPFIPAAVFWFFLTSCYWGSLLFLMAGIPMVPGLVFYLVVPLYKKHYYKVKDDPKERKLAVITTYFQCGAPILMELICFVSLIWLFSMAPAYLLVRIIYTVSFIPFILINMAFWRSFPKEEKKEA